MHSVGCVPHVSALHPSSLLVCSSIGLCYHPAATMTCHALPWPVALTEVRKVVCVCVCAVCVCAVQGGSVCATAAAAAPSLQDVCDAMEYGQTSNPTWVPVDDDMNGSQDLDSSLSDGSFTFQGFVDVTSGIRQFDDPHHMRQQLYRLNKTLDQYRSYEADVERQLAASRATEALMRRQVAEAERRVAEAERRAAEAERRMKQQRTL